MPTAAVTTHPAQPPRLGEVGRAELWPPRAAVRSLRGPGTRRYVVAGLVLFWVAMAYQACALALGYTLAVRAGSVVALIDGHAYWASWRDGLYVAPAGQKDAYLYSPAFAQLLWPLTVLPFWTFAVCWWGAIVGAYAWLVRPLAWCWRLPCVVLVVPDLVTGNIYAFWAVALVGSLRRPGLWSVLVLTKVLPGVGLLYYAARRDVGHLLKAGGGTAAVVGVSYAFAPHLWHDWVRFLLDTRNATSEAGVPHLGGLFPLRFGLALVLAVLAGLAGQVFVLPVVAAFATALSGAGSLGVLLAIPRLLAHHDDPARPSGATP